MTPNVYWNKGVQLQTTQAAKTSCSKLNSHEKQQESIKNKSVTCKC